MPRTSKTFAVVAFAVFWSACQDGRPIAIVTDHDGGAGSTGTGGSGVAGTTGVAGDDGGIGGQGQGPCDGAAALICGGAIFCGGACPTGGNAAGGAGVNDGGGGAAGTGAADAGAPDARQVGVGTLIACPASPPSGTCSVEWMNCAYPDTSCRCMGGVWSCSGCPASPQATTGTGAMCRYGNLTCSQWGCGACPDAHPTEGAVCGNAKFKCQYGNDACLCGGDVDGWRCSSLSCPEKPSSAMRSSCAAFTLTDRSAISFDHACSYAAENQTCACNDGTGFGTLICNCPAALPAEGSACVGPSPCTYGGATCNCIDNHWRCGGSCPPTKPTVGAGCSSQVSCSYTSAGATSYCSCNGSSWSCT
jgi:hypothetical protein